MRKQTLFHAGQEHQREFEPLDRVHRHQLHTVLPGIGLGFAGFQRRVREEGIECRHILLDHFVGFVILTGNNQFLQVFDTRLPFFRSIFTKMRLQPAYFYTVFDLLAERQFRKLGGHAAHQIDKCLQRAARPRAQSVGSH